MTPVMDIAFNHDGFDLLRALVDTQQTIEDVDRIFVEPLARQAVTVIDWCIASTGVHNCRTRLGRPVDRAFMTAAGATGLWGDRQEEFLGIADVIEHFNAEEKDLLDCVIEASHARNLRVFGSLRLNHGSSAEWMQGVPGIPHHHGGARRDFRDEAFHEYLFSLLEDILAKGVDGISLDFERKAPFFPEDTPIAERFAACRKFLQGARGLTDKPILARVSYQAQEGQPQGQKPIEWVSEGLLDVIVPATHNHNPDTLDWSVEPFVAAAASSPRPCAVWPQIWPTGEMWGVDAPRHSTKAVQRRAVDLRAMGADGVYFFNFCCYGPENLAWIGDYTTWTGREITGR